MKVAFLHPMARSYRTPLIMELSRKLQDFTVIFTCGSKMSHANPAFREDIQKSIKELKKNNVKIKIFKDIKNPIMGEEVNPFLFFELRRYDVIISSIPYRFSGITAFVVSKIFGKRLITWDETWKIPENRKCSAIKPLLKAVIKQAGACIVPGRAAKKFYMENGCPEDKIIISGNACPVPDPPDETMVERLKERYGIGNKKTFVYLGRIVPYKGLDILIEAFSKIGKPKEIFLLVGGSGDPNFEKKCREMAPENVAFVGPIKEGGKSAFICAGEFFVLPSRFMMRQNQCCESWGFTLNEAAQLGRGLISTEAVGAAYELINEGENGFIAKSGEAGSLANAIEKACERDAGEMGEKSRILSLDQNYGRMVSSFMEAIEKVENG